LIVAGCYKPPSFTARELEVLRLLCRGLVSNRDLAASMGISPFTVEGHVKQIMAKLEVQSRAQAIAQAYLSGLLE
jgi:DNA-binding CsgD family transcriptional regulator